MPGEFLDMQAMVGISKHVGGLPATRELLRLCRAAEAGEVLEVGCGIGAGLVHLAGTSPGHIVGVDISARMVEWSRRRASEHGVGDRIELHVADVQALPFDDDRFDAVVCESVLAFVGDQRRAIAELVRVTKPGGRVGLNEGILTTDAPDDVAAVLRDMGLTLTPTVHAWRVLWDESGLHDRTVTLRRLEPAVEVRNRLRWIGLPWLVGAYGRGLGVLLRNPEARHSMRVVGSGSRALEYTGYGLFVGTK